LERGADLLQESGFGTDATSSVALNRAFWNWREAAPGQPYWVHFQTTDVHAVGSDRLEVRTAVPVAPFAGLFVSPEDLATLRGWSARVQAGGARITSDAFKTGGVNRVAFMTLYQGLYDQQMAHNDYQLGRLIDRLKASGEWHNTVLIVTADHSIESALTATEIGMLESMPPAWNRPLFRPSVSRVPLLVVGPGRIAGGQRFHDAVSLIDLLPTALELARLSMPAVMQGQSLGPLMRGAAGWTRRPVILEELERDRETGEVGGSIEVVDGRWGATLEVGGRRPDGERPWPLLLYDLWSDPLCISPVNEQYPDLVKKYTVFLEDTLFDHQALAKQFTPGPKVALTPEQLERLRSLGYIR
jgi:hypothetical protein